jgi:hypothetical protein
VHVGPTYTATQRNQNVNVLYRYFQQNQCLNIQKHWFKWSIYGQCITGKKLNKDLDKYVNFPFICNNIPTETAYGLYI